MVQRYIKNISRTICILKTFVVYCTKFKNNSMKKLININGELSDKGSTANKLNVRAAEKGVSLTQYITEVLDKHVNNA